MPIYSVLLATKTKVKRRKEQKTRRCEWRIPITLRIRLAIMYSPKILRVSEGMPIRLEIEEIPAIAFRK